MHIFRSAMFEEADLKEHFNTGTGGRLRQVFLYPVMAKLTPIW
jgi:hypothetical protein